MMVRLLLITLFLLGVTNAIGEETTKTPPKTVRITISPETTYITEPFLADGRVDYFGALNRRLSEGITPENNIFAGVFTLIPGEEEYAIMRAIFEGEEDQPYVKRIKMFREKYYKMLGLDTLPDLDSLQILSPPGAFEPTGVDPYQELLKFYTKAEIDAKIESRKEQEIKEYRAEHEKGSLTDEQFAEKIEYCDSDKFRHNECRQMINHEFYYDAMEKFFTEKECPLMAAWMESTTDLAGQLIEVSKRPKSYNPLVASSDDTTMYEAILPYIQAIRQVARYFQARGNWHFGRGEHDEALECAFASLRIGMTMRTNAGFIVEELVGIACESIAHYDIVNYLGHLENKKDAAWILDKQKKYRAICERNVLSSSPPVWLNGERFGLLSVTMAAAYDPEYIKQFYSDIDLNNADQRQSLFDKCFDPNYDYDWDNVLRRINYHWEDWEDLLLIPEPRRRARALERLEDRIMEKTIWMETMEITTEINRENLLADFFYCTTSPAMSSYQFALLRVKCYVAMSDIAFSIAAYRADHGDYPETLEVLVPKYLDRIPDSPYTDKPMRYMKRANDVLLVNDNTYKLDGSEEKVEKMIAEAKNVDSVYPQPRSFVLILHKTMK